MYDLLVQDAPFNVTDNARKTVQRKTNLCRLYTYTDPYEKLEKER